MRRIKEFKKSEVSRFFTNIEEAMPSYKFFPLKIYNMDETGIRIVQEPGSILEPKGQKTFIDHVKPNPQKPILFVSDNHYSHITLES
jgi:arginyl-tRNA synthetase